VKRVLIFLKENCQQNGEKKKKKKRLEIQSETSELDFLKIKSFILDIYRRYKHRDDGYIYIEID